MQRVKFTYEQWRRKQSDRTCLPDIKTYYIVIVIKRMIIWVQD